MKNLLRKSIIFFYRHILGWKVIGRLPNIPKMIAVSEPHTSNLDVMFIIYISLLEGRYINWLVKEEARDWFFIGKYMEPLGAVFVNRSSPMKALKQIVNHIKERDEIILLFTPSGTRSYSDHWKEGFHFIARKSEIPILYASLDYGTKTITLSEPITPSKDIYKDIEDIRPFYEGVVARHPDKAGEIRILPKE